MPKVIIYSTPTCGYCQMAVNYFEDHGIQHEKIDVSKDRDALNDMIEMSGQMGVPVIKVGDKVLVGWNLLVFQQAYGGRIREDESGDDSGDKGDGEQSTV